MKLRYSTVVLTISLLSLIVYVDGRQLFAPSPTSNSANASSNNNDFQEVNGCRPPKGHTYLTIGQDLLGIRQYVDAQYVHNLLHTNVSQNGGMVKHLSAFAPAAAMVYTDLEKLQGLDFPAEYGSGIEFADGILDSIFPDTPMGLQIGLWLDGYVGCEHVVSGAWDHQIQNLTKYIFASSAERIFLRVGYEFDNPAFKYTEDPDTYKNAFQRIATLVREELVKLSGDSSKVLFVWHSWAAPLSSNLKLDQFYPGDDFVDWVGISVFQQFYPWAVKQGFGSIDDIERVVMFGQAHNKPIMIAESTPFGGLNDVTSEMKQYNALDAWNRWFSKVLDLIDRFDIGMWSYINCDWDALPMWKGVGFGQTELSRNSEVMQKWQEFVVNGSPNRTFLMSGSLRTCGTGNNSSNSAVPSPTSSSSNIGQQSNDSAVATVNTGDVVKQNQKKRPDGFLDTKGHDPQLSGSNNPPFTTGKQSINEDRPSSSKPQDQKFGKKPNPADLAKESNAGDSFGGKVLFVFIVIVGLIYCAHYQGQRESSLERRNSSTSTFKVRGIGRSGYSYINGNDDDSLSYMSSSVSSASRDKNSMASVIHV